MKSIIAIAVLAVSVISTAATATAFIKIDQSIRSTKLVSEPVTQVVYGHRIGPNGQEMLVTKL